jgi:hypothetical protein
MGASAAATIVAILFLSLAGTVSAAGICGARHGATHSGTLSKAVAKAVGSPNIGLIQWKPELATQTCLISV